MSHTRPRLALRPVLDLSALVAEEAPCSPSFRDQLDTAYPMGERRPRVRSAACPGVEPSECPFSAFLSREHGWQHVLHVQPLPRVEHQPTGAASEQRNTRHGGEQRAGPGALRPL